MKHGKGTLKLANGDVYKAEWKFDHLNGKGIHIEKNGTRHKVVWHNDIMIPLGK